MRHQEKNRLRLQKWMRDRGVDYNPADRSWWGLLEAVREHYRSSATRLELLADPDDETVWSNLRRLVEWSRTVP